MKYQLTVLFALFAVSSPVHADIWKWVDANGVTHFVSTKTPIYTWTDEFGKAHYSDTPGNASAVSVELVWHSAGSIVEDGSGGSKSDSADPEFSTETAAARAERKQAEDYYCRQAIEIYESYLNAPRLYRTSENGEREYLSAEEAAKTLAETRARKDEICS